LVPGHADAYQVIGLQHFERFLFGQSHFFPSRRGVVILADALLKL
jgi:hypothetical protein